MARNTATTSGVHSRMHLVASFNFSSATPNGTRSGDVAQTMGMHNIWLDSPGHTPITVLLLHQNDVRDVCECVCVRVCSLWRGAAAV